MKYAALALLMLAPGLVLGAGFARSSLFLSDNSPTEDTELSIHAVVVNDAPAAFAGEMTFSAKGGGQIGGVAVSLGAGEAGTVSVRWEPAAGTHTVVAELHAEGEVLASEEAVFVVAPRPASSENSATEELAAATVESSKPLEEGLAAVSPEAASAAAPVFKALDAGRNAAAGFLDQGIEWSKRQITEANQTKESAPAGTEGAFNAISTASSIASTILLYVLTVLRFIVGSIAFFYPLLVIAFFYLLWRTFRRFRRPAY